MRMGDWKINFVPPPFGSGKWELHNLRTDPGETVDLREEQSDVFAQLSAAWEEYLKTHGVIWGSPAPMADMEDDEMADPVGWMKSSV